VAPSNEIASGSIADITQRLLIWGQRQGMGLVWVEFSSEFARQAVLQRLQAELSQRQIPFQDLVLPTYQPPVALADGLLEQLAQCPAGVVSISGLATAFGPRVPLAEGLLALNLRRERLAQRPLRQIWWMTPLFLQAALHAMPDLMSWFGLRLHLTETIKVEQPGEPLSESAVNIDDAKRRAFRLIQRLEQAQQAGAGSEALLTLYLLPALEALAEAGAQKDLRNLTSRFEGYLGTLKMSESLEISTSLDRLGQLYYRQGRYLEAEPLYQKALRLRQHLLDPEHSAVASSLNNLALLHESQGRYAEAEPLLERALSILEQQLGQTHPHVARSLNNLAKLYKSQGRYAEAEPLYERARSILEQQLGPTHPHVATSLNNLALLYESQGRYAEAEPLLERSLSIHEQQLGLEHPDVARSLNNLALLYESQGRYAEAEPLYERALSIREQQLGPTHPHVATSLNNLAGLYESQGRYAEAELLLERALSILEQQLGPVHPDVATSLNNLAGLYESQGRYAEAERLYLKCLRILFQVSEQSGFEHPNLNDGRQNFSGFLEQVAAAGRQAELSDDPRTQALLAQIQFGAE
jgi:tetratricopeptide (TPR) repeat protein